MDVLSRVDRDVADGRLWKARDRLAGACVTAPHDAVLLDRLGEVCFAMADLPAAGRAWLLAGRDDESARAALAAFEERAPAPVDRLRATAARAPLERYPALAQRRIAALREEASAAGDVWSPRSEGGRAPQGGRAPDGDTPALSADLADGVIVAAGILLTVGVWLVGAGFLVSRLVRAVF